MSITDQRVYNIIELMKNFVFLIIFSKGYLHIFYAVGN